MKIGRHNVLLYSMVVHYMIKVIYIFKPRHLNLIVLAYPIHKRIGVFHFDIFLDPYEGYVYREYSAYMTVNKIENCR